MSNDPNNPNRNLPSGYQQPPPYNPNAQPLPYPIPDRSGVYEPPQAPTSQLVDMFEKANLNAQPLPYPTPNQPGVVQMPEAPPSQLPDMSEHYRVPAYTPGGFVVPTPQTQANQNAQPLPYPTPNQPGVVQMPEAPPSQLPDMSEHYRVPAYTPGGFVAPTPQTQAVPQMQNVHQTPSVPNQVHVATHVNIAHRTPSVPNQVQITHQTPVHAQPANQTHVHIHMGSQNSEMPRQVIMDPSNLNLKQGHRQGTTPGTMVHHLSGVTSRLINGGAKIFPCV